HRHRLGLAIYVATSTPLGLPANLCAGGTHVGRYHPMPANSVGVRVHYVWLVNAAINAEAELVLADAAAPIRLWRRAHGAHVDCTGMLCGLVLLDVIGKCELRATDRGLLVESIGRAPDKPTQPAWAGSANPALRLCRAKSPMSRWHTDAESHSTYGC